MKNHVDDSDPAWKLLTESTLPQGVPHLGPTREVPGSEGAKPVSLRAAVMADAGSLGPHQEGWLTSPSF